MTKSIEASSSGHSKVAKKLGAQQNDDAAVWSICDVMRRGNVASARQYVPELTWILFLRILDETEEREALEAKVLGHDYTPSLSHPYRWDDWARPIDPKAPKSETNTRRELTEQGSGKLLEFANARLIPHLKALRDKPDSKPRQKVIAEILSGVERVRIDTETNLLEVLDKVHEISQKDIDPTHVVALTQVYEGLLLKMGEKGSDAGQFFTPREVIRSMVRVLDPQGRRTDLRPVLRHGRIPRPGRPVPRKEDQRRPRPSARDVQGRRDRDHQAPHVLRSRERASDLPDWPCKPDPPRHRRSAHMAWHGNALTGHEVYGGLFHGAPDIYEVILANPPFGGKENAKSITGFDYPTSATEILFLQSINRTLAPGGRCGVVLPDGVLFRTNEEAFTKTKKKLLEECALWCIVSLPGGGFTAAGAGVKTNLLFLTRGKATEKIWYYVLSERKVGKKTPLTLDDFGEFFDLLPERADSDKSWTLDFTARRRKAADDARPFRHAEAEKKAESNALRDTLNGIKKARPRDEGVIAETQAALDAATRAAREAADKAQAIEDVVYDLKAVNPNKKAALDTRTPDELIELIELKGREVAEALATLRDGLRQE